MEKTKYEIDLPKESLELAQGIEKFVKSLHLALSDGFQVGQDLPIIVSSAIADMIPALAGSEKIGEELKADPVAVAQAFAIIGGNLAKSFTKK